MNNNHICHYCNKELVTFEDKILFIIHSGWIKQTDVSKKQYQNKIMDAIIDSLGFGSYEHFRWENDKADYKRFDFNIDENSVVVDAGGYEGAWANEISNKYGCNIYIFEPYTLFYNNIVKRFANTHKITVYNKGLGDTDRDDTIYLNNDGTSIYNKTDKSCDIKIISFNNFLAEKEIAKIDLMKINIEGGEYELLLSIIRADNQKKIRNFLIQFHRFPENHESNKQAIYDQLIKTHNLVFRYDYVWEHWQLKD